MYVRSDGHKKLPKDISIPQNYSGNAFIPKEAATIESSREIAEETKPSDEEVFKPICEERKGFLSGLAGNDDLLLLGLILLLSQDGFGDDILPIILIMLFLKK